MPLLDAYGHEIGPNPRRPKKPKKVLRKPRVPLTRVPIRLNQSVEVLLTAKHNLSGHLYGPGREVVPRKVAQVLMENERRAQWSDANFAGSRACVIGPGATKGGLRVKEVAPEYFDSDYSNAVPFGVVDRRTATFTSY